MGTITESTGIVVSSSTYGSPNTETTSATPSSSIFVSSSERQEPFRFQNFTMVDNSTSVKSIIPENWKDATSESDNLSAHFEYASESMPLDNYDLTNLRNTEDTEYAVSVSNSSSPMHQECTDTENTRSFDGGTRDLSARTPEGDCLDILKCAASDDDTKDIKVVAVVGSEDTHLEATSSSGISEAIVETGIMSSENVKSAINCSPKALKLVEADGIQSEKVTLTGNSILENKGTHDKIAKIEITDEISETDGMKSITNKLDEDKEKIQETLPSECMVIGTYGSTFHDAEISSGISSGSECLGNNSDVDNVNNKDSSNDQAERRFQCNICGKRFHSRANLLRHEVVHTGKKGYPCSICGKEFSREYNLTTHRRIHTEEKNFKCDICGKGFYWKSCLTRHMGVHTDKDDFTCHVCGKVFFNKSYVMGHMVVHTKEKVFKCDICGKGFSFKVSLRKHKVMHTNEKEFKCDICGKEFFQKSNLNLHRVVHTVEREFKCDICEKVFTSKTYLADHIALHTGEFTCDICGKIFKRGKFLVQHRVKHDNPNAPRKPLISKVKGTCEICGKTFSRKSHLTLHMVVHSGERNFKCDECGKTFFHKFNLVQHNAIHTGDIKCMLCGRVFGRQSRLRDHMKTHMTKKYHQVGEIFPSTISSSDSGTDLSFQKVCSDPVEEITIENIKTEDIIVESIDDQMNYKDNDDSVNQDSAHSQNGNMNSLNQTDSRNSNSAPCGSVGSTLIERATLPYPSGCGIFPSLFESQTKSTASRQNGNISSQNPSHNIVSQLPILRYLMTLRAGVQEKLTQLPSNHVSSFMYAPNMLAYANNYNGYSSNPNFVSGSILTTTQDGTCSENESSKNLNSVTINHYSVSGSHAEQISGSKHEFSTSVNKNYDFQSENTVPGVNNSCVKEVEEIYIPTTIKVEREEDLDSFNSESDVC